MKNYNKIGERKGTIIKSENKKNNKYRKKKKKKA